MKFCGQECVSPLRSSASAAMPDSSQKLSRAWSSQMAIRLEASHVFATTHHHEVKNQNCNLIGLQVALECDEGVTSMTNGTCIACQSPKFVAWFSKRSKIDGLQYPIFRCSRCRSAFVVPRPTA